MKNITLLLIAITTSAMLFGQPTGYYNGTEGLEGDELKTALNGIIDDHVEFSYFAAKTIFKLSDADPENPNNVIQVYTGFSHDNTDYGNSGLELNREHVWAKSHGNFVDIQPMFGDVHNLKPSAAEVNQDKSNLDFDNGGVEHDVALGNFYTESTWEARDEVKGDIARIIFYMDTRYEGNNGESNLTVVDEINTYPLPEHGKLSTLLEWNNFDPPDEFERNRNNVIFSWQQNRNPFIDNPEYANLIWGGAEVSPISFSDFSNSPAYPIENDVVTVNATVASTSGAITVIQLYWGLDFENLDNIIDMVNTGGDGYSVDIPGQNGAETVYYQIVASDGANTSSSIAYNYYVSPVFSGQMTSIYDIQGQTEVSPYDSVIVNTTGVVTANFGDNYFIQDGYGDWNGLFVYESGRNPAIGDSVVITGMIKEYYGKTELTEISDYYHISSNNELPLPVFMETVGGTEAYESVLVNVNNATCIMEDYGSDYFMWHVDDGSGMLKIHNTSIFEYEPELNESYNITGPLNYDFDEWKIEIRFEDDVMEGTDFIPPTISSVESINNTTVKVVFSETVEEASAQTIENYIIDNGIDVLNANRHALQHSIVFLTVSSMETNDYTIHISNVEDLAGNIIEDGDAGFSHIMGIGDLFSEADISIYPNPTSNYFTLSIPSLNDFDEELVLSINNLAGQLIYTEHFNTKNRASNFEVNTSMLKKGMYLIKISSGSNYGMQKLLIK